jgi:hypothetical protein
MRLPLLLLLLAGVLLWLGAALETAVTPASEIVLAQRAERSAQPMPTIRNVSEDNALEPIPSLFRGAVSPTPLEAQAGERFSLLGIAGSPGARVAFLRDQADSRSITAREGEMVGAWTVVEIGSNCVIMRRRSQQERPCL